MTAAEVFPQTTAHTIATELRGMAGELLARSDVAREQGALMSAYQAAHALLARADHLDGV